MPILEAGQVLGRQPTMGQTEGSMFLRETVEHTAIQNTEEIQTRIVTAGHFLNLDDVCA